MPIPCLAYPAVPPPDPELLRRFEALSTSLISDVFDRWAGAPGILPVAALKPGKVVAGPAFTVRTRPGDNLVVHKALDIAEPGDFVVVAAGGATDRAILGGLMAHYSATRDLGALVVDGAVRDASDLDKIGLPVFARGLSHLGPYKDGPGELRGQVSIAGLPVANGDIVIGDEDGICVVPRGIADEIIVAAEAKGAAEERTDAEIERGEWDRGWIDEALDITWL